eukprot:8788669-Pyramimonas_sp.AAC.1
MIGDIAFALWAAIDGGGVDGGRGLGGLAWNGNFGPEALGHADNGQADGSTTLGGGRGGTILWGRGSSPCGPIMGGAPAS